MSFEFQDLVAPCKRAGYSHGLHRRFRAGVAEANHFSSRDHAGDLLRNFDLEFGCRSEHRSFLDLFSNGIDNGWVTMPEDERSVGQQVVDVFVPVDIPDSGALSPLEDHWERFMCMNSNVG